MKQIAFIVVLMLVSFSFMASAVSPCTIVLNPSEKTVDVGSTFTVVLYVNIVGEADTAAVDLITWDGNVLECTNILKGDLFTNPIIWIPGTISSGQITGSVMASNIPIHDTNGVYSTLTFHVIASGTTTITISGFGVARAGAPLITSIGGNCYINTSDYTPPTPPPNPPPTNPPVTPPNTPPNTPPVTPPQNNTNNTQPPVTPPVVPPQNNETNETTPPVTPPVPEHQNNSNNSTPVSTSNDDFWHNYFVPLAIMVVLMTGITITGITIRRRKPKKEKKEEKDIFDENIDDRINDIINENKKEK